MSLPTFIALISEDKILRYIDEDEDQCFHHHLRFCGTEPLSSRSKFELEPSKQHDGLVHIKCCHSNRYWASNEPDSCLIVARAKETQEDVSECSCTLFKPSFRDDGDSQYAIFQHVCTRYFVSVVKNDQYFSGCLLADAGHPRDILRVIDWDSMVILPRYVRFKGDNGKYLCTFKRRRRHYLQFSTDEATDETVAFEILPTGDGNVRIKSIKTGRFWRHYHGSVRRNWVRADAKLDENSSDMIFRPRRDAHFNNYITLQNLGSGFLCEKRTLPGKVDFLAGYRDPSTTEIPCSARMMVEEYVKSREIYDVTYRFEDAKIRRETLTKSDRLTAHNARGEGYDMISFKYSSGEKISCAWKSMVSYKIGGGLRLKAQIPVFIGKLGEVGYDTNQEYNKGYEWGCITELRDTIEVSYTAAVPPNKTVIVHATEKVIELDIPFSYTEKLTLGDGKEIIHKMDDGVYLSKRSYDFGFKCEQAD